MREPVSGRLIGRTADSDSVNPGSSPGPTVITAPTPDTVTRHINRLIDQPVHRSVMERYGLTRVPGSVVYDENGEAQ